MMKTARRSTTVVRYHLHHLHHQFKRHRTQREQRDYPAIRGMEGHRLLHAVMPLLAFVTRCVTKKILRVKESKRLWQLMLIL